MPTTTPVDQVRLVDFTDAEPQTGMGFNSATLVFPGTALTFSPGSPDPAETGQVVAAHATIINSHEELMDRIGVSVAASGRYGLASASAKVDFSKTTGFNSSSTFVLAEASVRNPIVRGKDFRLTGTASQLLTAVNLDGFKTAFGDSFVRGIKSGGEFFAVFRLTSLKQQTQQQLASTLTAEINGLIGAGSFSGAFNTAQQSENDRAEVEISFYQAAGSGITSSITLDVNDILTRLKNFPAIAHDNPFPFKAEIATYDTIPIPIPPPVEIEDFIFSMSQDEKKKLDYVKRKNDVDLALQHAEYFDDLPSPTDLGADSEVYTQLINAVMSHQVRLAKGQFPTPEIFDPAKVGLTEPIPRQFKRKVGILAAANTWAAKTPMPATRGTLGLAAASNGKLYAIGGDANFTIVATVAEYDPSTNTWSAAAPMPFPLSGHGVAAAGNGKVYAIGGSSGEDNTSAVAEYDPVTNAWTTKAFMPTPRGGLGVAAAKNGKIYAVGGNGNDHPGILNDVEEYDPATNKWTRKAPMPTARFLFGLAAAGNGKLYAVGGVDSNIHTVGVVEEYDPATNSWATKAPMLTPRSNLGLAAASNGKLYAVGGAGGLDVVEEYDPATNRWASKTPMPTARFQFGFAAASNGRLYAAGGLSAVNDTRIATLEEYTP